MADLVYNPPGVFVDEDATPVPNISSIVAIPPSRVALVGPSIGYETNTEPLKMTGTAPQAVSKTGATTGSIVVKSQAGVTYTLTTDYTVATTGTPAEEAVVTVTRVGSGAIAADEVVYVTYNYTNSAFYQPLLSADWDEIQTKYGPAIDPVSGLVGSPLSLAAKIVMEQGCRELILVPTKGSSVTAVTAAQLNSAYATLESRDDVGLVVPLTIGITGSDVAPGDTVNVAQQLKTHCESMANAGKFRVGVFGYDTGATRTHSTVAQSIASSRVMLAYPNIMLWFNGYTNQTIEIGGTYLAAAYAGMFASRLPSEPLTHKSVRSFSSIPARIFSAMTTSFKNNLSDSGVAVTEQLTDGRLSVRHGVTTSRTNVLTKEMSIVRAKDTLIQLCYQAVDQANIIGSPMNSETAVRVQSIVEGALVQAVNSGIILDYSNLQSRRKAGDLTAIQVKFAYTPLYPLNRVEISFSINTVTGSIAA